MRKLLLPASLLLLLFSAVVVNIYLLHKELREFYLLVINEETARVKSIVEGTIAGGGDPVEALYSYMESSKLLKGATFKLEGREIIVPSSDISPDYSRETIKLKPFTFTLYFDFSYLKELNKHITYIFISLLFFTVLFTLVTVWLVREYFREKLFHEKERQERERLESINLVIHSLIHEVKNRLNVLRLLSHKIEAGCGGNTCSDYLLKLRTEIDNLGKYLEETADLRRPLKIFRRSVSSELLLKNALSKFGELLRTKGVELQLSVEDAILNVDPEKFTSLLIDLIKNAVEALEGKNRKKTLKIVGKREGSFYTFYVMDSGGELPKSDIFKPFYSTKEKGFGLGLYNVKRIAEAHGGEVSAYTEGDWTVFKVSVPLNRRKFFR